MDGEGDFDKGEGGWKGWKGWKFGMLYGMFPRKFMLKWGYS
jgi:hypothetical protein